MSGKTPKLFVEIADTPIKRAYGLMDRHTLSKDMGMLFRFPYKHNLSFWMQNTYIPLDVAFIDDDGKILQIESMVPLSTRVIQSKHRCRYALEVSKGWFEQNGIMEGCRIGGVLTRKMERIAQETGVPEQMDMELNLPPQEAPNKQEKPQPQQQQPITDYQVNMTFRRRFQRVNAHNKLRINANRQADVLVGYQTEKGVSLLPRIVRGPFTFEGGANGELVLLVDISPSVNGVSPDGRKWSCDPGIKTFLLENILWMTEVKRNDPSQEQQIIAWMRELPENKQMEEQHYFNWMPETQGKL